MSEDIILDSEKQIEVTKEYLEHVIENLKRLKAGKKPKRKFKYIFSDHKKLLVFTFIGLLISVSLLSYFLAYTPTHITEEPKPDIISQTLSVIKNNFTNAEGLILDPQTQNPTSRAMILETLMYSMLVQGGYISLSTSTKNELEDIKTIIDNHLFVELRNKTISLSPFYQWMGFTSLVQAYFTLKNKKEGNPITRDFLFNCLEALVNKTYNTNTSFIMDNNDTASLKTQAYALWGLVSYSMLVNYLFTNYYKSVAAHLALNIFDKLYNATTNTFYSYYNVTVDRGCGSSNVYDLILLTIAVYLVEQSTISVFLPLSSYYLHQIIVNGYVNNEWIISSYENEDVYQICLQSLFTLASFLLRLTSVANETLNVVKTYFWVENKGFVEDLTSRKISSISCVYGLIGIASENWSRLQVPEHTPTFKGGDYGFTAGVVVTIILATILTRKRRKLKKN